MGIERCQLINLPKISDIRGNLTVVESEKHIPFEIKRTFYLYGVPAGENRAGHAHQDLHQFLIASIFDCVNRYLRHPTFASIFDYVNFRLRQQSFFSSEICVNSHLCHPKFDTQ